MKPTAYDLHVMAERIEKAAAPEDVFGELTGSAEERLQQVSATYRQLVAVLHPDRFSAGADQELARTAFIKATALKSTAEQKVADGSYGDRRASATTTPGEIEPLVIKIRKQQYALAERIAVGDVADLYRATTKTGTVVCKVARNVRDNDLMQREVELSRALYPVGAKDESYRRFLVKLLDSFILRGTDGSRRRVNVFPLITEHVTLRQVMDAYPDGLDYRDMAWMLKRMLQGAGFIHAEGIVHGAINPAHVLVGPKGHGAKFVDWCHGVKLQPGGTQHISVVSPGFADYCAPEVKAKCAATPATDIYSIAACAVALVGGDPATGHLPECVPRKVRAFLAGCMLTAPTRRPDSAWDLHEEFDEVLRSLVGRPRYRPLEMPA